MKVTLLRLDGLDVAMLAASCCTSAEMPTEPRPEGLIAALRSGHDSLLEHITVSFAIEGISRVCLAQLCRHRHISLSVQSQRYVDTSRADCVFPPFIHMAAEEDDTDLTPTLKRLDEAMDDTIDILHQRMGLPDEDVRYLYPQGITTNLILTTNFREFSHMCGLRRCNRAQAEIRDLFCWMIIEVDERLYRSLIDNDHIGLYNLLSRRLRPQCIQVGYCPEARSCGWMPPLSELKDAYMREHKRAKAEESQ